MPGSVITSNVGTLPWSLSSHFPEELEWKALISKCKDGSSQRAEQVSSGHKIYNFAKRLTAAAMSHAARALPGPHRYHLAGVCERTTTPPTPISRSATSKAAGLKSLTWDAPTYRSPLSRLPDPAPDHGFCLPLDLGNLS
jgi:hypothetical protein